MANTAKTTKKEEDTSITAEELQRVNEEQAKTIKDLQEQMKQILEKINNQTNVNSTPVQVIDTSSKMDRPCTLIHLLECPHDLPTTIKVGNRPPYKFTKFGETRTFRFSDMENIVRNYEDFFRRGIFTLGDDCEEFKDELGADYIIKDYIPVNVYKKIETVNSKDFERLIKNLNDTQRVHLATTWVQRYNEKKSGYNDINKIKILNKYTKDKEVFKKGVLHDFLANVVDED